MPSNLNLDYYYGNEAEQYSFYRIPKTLLTDPRYKSVSVEAKVLYGLLLDRMGLSVKNGWMDSDKRVYIYFTQEDAMNLMGCGKDKATKLFRELDKDGSRARDGPPASTSRISSCPRNRASPSSRNRHRRPRPLRLRKISSLDRWTVPHS